MRQGHVNQGDAPAYELINQDSKRKNLLICTDHASNFIPKEMKNLGLTDAQMERHIAYDIGSKGVAMCIADTLNATTLIAQYSRLMIDLNRHWNDPTSIRAIYDGALVPGNLGLSQDERDRRKAEIFDPYHEKLSCLIQQRISHCPLIVSIHSFTPIMNDKKRPWHIGILSGEDRRAATIALDYFRTHHKDLTLGDNKPYSGRDGYDYTMSHHVFPLGLPSLLVEIRQDMIKEKQGQMEFGKYLSACILHILSQNINKLYSS